MSFDNLPFPAIIGFLTAAIAILVKVIGLPDQIRQNLARKSTKGLSSIFITLAFISYGMWTLHGVLQKDNVLIIGQGVGLLTTGIVLYQIFLYRKKG